MLEKCKWIRIVGGVFTIIGVLFRLVSYFLPLFYNGIGLTTQIPILFFSAFLSVSFSVYYAVTLFIGKPRLIASALCIGVAFSVVGDISVRLFQLSMGAAFSTPSIILSAVTTLLSIAASILLIAAFLMCEKRKVPLALWIIPIVLLTLLGVRDVIGGSCGDVAGAVRNLMVLYAPSSMRETIHVGYIISAVLFVPVLFKNVCDAVWGLVNYGTRG